MSALSEPERLVRDALSWASDYQPGRAPNLDGHARDLVAALRPLLAADPEIVTGEQARELPDGSRFVRVEHDGLPEPGTPVKGGGDYASEAERYMVLHRAPTPAPKVGDVVRTEAELDRLPERSVIRTRQGLVVERIVVRPDGGWLAVGSHDPRSSSQFSLPATVLHVGGDS